MLSNYGDHLSDEILHYINAAQACPKVRARMSEVPCRATHLGQSCLYNSLVTTLDILQRRAYEEIRLKVVRAVDDRLPPELTVLIFEYTMAAEEVPFDPRVYVNARNKETGQIRRKSRMICPHLKDVLEPRTELRRANGKRPTLAYSDEWEEIEGFNHLDMFKRRAENDTYRYDKFFEDLDAPDGVEGDGETGGTEEQAGG